MENCVVLFSGGIDSTTALYWALDRFEKVHALTVDYGQRHRVEVRMASQMAREIGVSQKVIVVDMTQIGGSSLTDAQIELPEYRSVAEIDPGRQSTYVPFRNGILLSMAAAWAEVIGARNIVCGFNIIDSPNYPDTRNSFVLAMEKAVNEGTHLSENGRNVRIHAPFIKLKKSEIIKKGLDLGADYAYSISCYSGREVPCLKCSACLLRMKAWEETGREDPLIARLKKEGRL